MIPVRKPGRPLTSCPHTEGQPEEEPPESLTIAIPRKRKCDCMISSEVETKRNLINGVRQATSDGISQGFVQGTKWSGKRRSIRANSSSTHTTTSPLNISLSTYEPFLATSSPLNSQEVSKVDPEPEASHGETKTHLTAQQRTQSSSRRASLPVFPAVSLRNPPFPTPPSAGSDRNGLRISRLPGAMETFLEQDTGLPRSSSYPRATPYIEESVHTFTSAEIPGLGLPVPSLVIDRPPCSHCCHEPVAVSIHPPYSGTSSSMAIPLDLNQISRGREPYLVLVAGTMPPPTRPDGVNGNLSIGNTTCDESCSCGPECQCIGCIAHPFNEAMQEYVRSTWQYRSEDPGSLGQEVQLLDTSMTMAQPQQSFDREPDSYEDQVLPEEDFLLVNFPVHG